ncbi:penicillin-binding protein [Virgibacillus oceani]|uniref:serine-type D-Ala-D-Ala carboxypeptidase n=1 Tax=Virgibacillus oceani TaxID=1479511 RepID=A0A917M0F4_9BACI|nr:penicillin-binding protein [Virgibacillus oceani]GGG69815.1 penicillin-binding protein 2B [Virgibacillus oceani]
MKKNKTTHFMSGIFILVFVAIFLILTGRFLYIQATGEINGVSLEEWADKKRTSSYPLNAERGKIFDSNGMTLAYDRPTFSIYAIVDETYTTDEEEPKHVKDPEKTAEVLAPLLNIDKSYIQQRLEKGIKNDKFQVEFGSGGKELSQKTKDKIEDLDLPGIKFDKEAIRYYPNGMFASHIIGFARKGEDGKTSGVTGMEREMNKLLSGKAGHISYQRDKYNTKLLDPNEVIKQPKDGDNVYLTIDQKVQTLLEDVMSQVDKKYEPERMTAIVMNPKTGEIVAMSNRPSYNPNNPADVENWYNDAVSTPIEPGSTMKMFTWASAIDAGVYNGNAMYKSGSYKVTEGSVPINDHNGGRGWGTISFNEGFRRSSNVAAAKLVSGVIGPEKYLNYLKAFDFNQKTGIDLPGEVIGRIVHNPNAPRDIASTGFGQASTFTPIQIMKAASAIANDGKMVKPYVISKIVDSITGEELKETSPEVVGKPISKETSDRMMELLGSVVTAEDGTGKGFSLEDYSVAGKTGTAQYTVDGKYATGREKYIFSFLGMAPADDPQLMMYVSIKHPQLEAEHGSVPVSFIFKNVMKNSLHYLNIKPDKESTNSVQTVKIPELKGEGTKAAKQALKGLNVTVIGAGDKIIGASAAEGEELLPNDRILLLTDEPTMPAIIGWSLRDVLQLAELAQLDIETIGNGYAFSQSIKEGTAIKKGDYLGVELKPPEKEKKNPDKESAENQEGEQAEQDSEQSE